MHETAISFPSAKSSIKIAQANTRSKGADARREYSKQAFMTGFAIAVVDLFAVLLSLVLAINAVSLFIDGLAFTGSIIPYVFFVVSVIACFLCSGLYKSGLHPVYEVRNLLTITSGGALLAASHMYVAGAEWQVMVGFLPIAAIVIPVSRSFGRNVLVRQNWWGIRCLVFGANRRVESLYKQHEENAKSGLKPVGFLQENIDADCSKDISRSFHGHPRRTRYVADAHKVSCALVHRCGRNDNDLSRFIDDRLQGFSRVTIVHDDPRLPSLWSQGAAGYSIEDNLLKPTAQFIKRSLDLAISLTAIGLGLPLLALIAIWVKATSEGPVFYGNVRIGAGGRRFKVWKFRTMVTNASEVLERHLENSPELRTEWETTFKLKKDPRITSVGRFLRKTSLDELPQLWNVLLGDMSLVGPRPILEDEIDRYNLTYDTYLRVRPGITGFWQVSGRNLTSYDRRVELVEFYVRNWSVWFDVYILFRTVKTVLLREGAY